MSPLDNASLKIDNSSNDEAGVIQQDNLRKCEKIFDQMKNKEFKDIKKIIQDNFHGIAILITLMRMNTNYFYTTQNVDVSFNHLIEFYDLKGKFYPIKVKGKLL